MATIKEKQKKLKILIDPRERILIWRKAKGMWKNKKPDPIKELRKIRKELERKII
ncbi:MAG: hypothetical protein ACK4GR_04720 [bacterium]